MMDSSHGGQEELAPVAGLRDGFHQSRTALAERVPDGRESHPQISDQRTIAVVRWRECGLGRDCEASGAESPTANRIAKPDTILAWYRKLDAQKFDGSKKRGLAGRPRVDASIEELVVKLARENSGWGYDRIVGAVANLSHEISDQSVGNTLAATWDRTRREAQTKHNLE